MIFSTNPYRERIRMSGSNASSIPDSQWRLDAHLLSIAHLPPCSSGRAGQHDQLYPAACVMSGQEL